MHPSSVPSTCGASETNAPGTEVGFLAKELLGRPVFDVVTLALVVVGAIAACVAAYYAHEQILIAREASERELRAYLGPVTDSYSLECLGCDGPNGPDAGRNVLKYKVKNYGTTPAFAVVSCNLFAPLKHDGALGAEDISALRAYCDEAENRIDQGTIWPGEALPYERSITDPTWITDVREQKSRWLMVWRFTYKDTFGKSRETWSCKEYLHDGRDDIFVGCATKNIPQDK